jgi:hypothetical protein
MAMVATEGTIDAPIGKASNALNLILASVFGRAAPWVLPRTQARMGPLDHEGGPVA